MSDWKEQLRKIKQTLFTESPKKKGKRPIQGLIEKPAYIDFVPPASWLEGSLKVGRSTPPCTTSAPKTQKPSLSRSSSADHVKDQREAASQTKAPTKRQLEFRLRINPNRSLAMPEWAEEGRSLQHPDHQGPKSSMTIRIGLDFGTAFTKVVIRAGHDLIPVDWSMVTGDASDIGRYVMPGFIYRSRDGEYHWRGQSKSEILANLKLSSIETSKTDECPTATLAYLALVIRYARAFLYQQTEIGRMLAARSLRWELNIGCPTEPHERPEVVARLQRIARIAWQLAGIDNLHDSNIEAAWQNNQVDVGLETDPGVVPEFVAQIAGYLGSSQVREGLHALIDIGAGTLDMATFNIVLPSNNSETLPRIPIFFSAVRPLGTHYLNSNRYSSLGLEPAWDDAAPIEPASDFSRRYGCDPDRVNAVDSNFIDQVKTLITCVIDGTRTNLRGDPGSRAWSEGLPMFITGGGAECELYRRAIYAAQSELKQQMSSPSRFRFIELDPVGARFPEDPKGRLSVAIGLTEDTESIARIIPHREIGPIERSVRERPDHSELYIDR